MGFGFGFGFRPGRARAQHKGGSVSLTAPTLTWTSAETVDPPTFNIDLTDPQENDYVRLYRDGIQVGEHQLTAGELTSLTFDLGLTAWGNGTYSATAKHERDGVQSAASDPVAVTIAVASAWTPLDLGAKLLHYSDPKVSGAPAGSTVADLSSAGNDLTITGAAYTVDAFGAGRDGFALNGTSNYLETASLSYGLQKIAIAAIAILDADAPADGRLAAVLGGIDSNDYQSTASATAIYRSGSTTDLSSYRGAAGAGGTITYGTRFGAISQYDGTNHTMDVDGTTASVATTADNFGATITISIGAGYEGGHAYFWKGKVGPIVICNDSLTTQERSDLDAWLAAW